ncbi:NAD(P)H dehydrogenase (quinone) [Flavobacterium sp. 90]|uniref:NmrA family NAD(P)-binding protein n=1 Tax=unclassified Flavobacterium TaxID=196869 RepID=UPI000EB0FD57|nr:MULTISPECIES: NmrA family NAD(P)-binding protein [unclassified Flavobacterium]RKR08939.1 NAD(P)H dehydrogenase (quinone) [Flavobacterium sp. 81]TCK52727.1 NAD(P)H dehydrogenase (quinone) [Flavobacterium sp. 90]
MILVTGASGNLGSWVIENLLKQVPAHTISVLQRNSKKAASFQQKGITVHIGDYGDKESIINALRDVTKLLLISSSGPNALSEHKNVIDAARESGVKHIYYTGGALNQKVKESKLGSLADSYITTENYIIESGLTYTVFQNGLYAETIPYFVGDQVLENGIYFPAGQGKASFAKREEMGEAIANVLASEGHENKIYITTGLPSHSFSEIAQMLSVLSGKPVAYYSPESGEFESQLREHGVSEDDIWVSSLFAAVIKNQEFDISRSHLAELLGRKPADLKTYLKETFIN